MSEEIEIEALGVEVSSQPIELYKVLKIADAVSGGGEAKYAIAEGYVAVNGELETRKRRKLYDGDLIEFNQEFYVVICDAPADELEEVFDVVDTPVEPVKPIAEKSKKPKTSKQAKSSKQNRSSKKADKSKKANASKPKNSGPKDETTGRGSISF
ncbi:RNA-binding S4 domain-containing protein [Vibrio sp. SCSIO 43136]|uniref:RNA-binding S4 domain-containing protein n=1 Tax=Vibrio sp. SCSIO 43136 TaxID=2819101 RepID=UPI002075D836|nr:RNA-binding S4 domain-containing protein [Vibrio sp. SCSIO 43136]USD67661.1 RNA-binding S4 domain-containing protein [Vibrio sp. SCSIO 43136]